MALLASCCLMAASRRLESRGQHDNHVYTDIQDDQRRPGEHDVLDLPLARLRPTVDKGEKTAQAAGEQADCADQPRAGLPVLEHLDHDQDEAGQGAQTHRKGQDLDQHGSSFLEVGSIVEVSSGRRR